jgi:hypothetical protein
MLGILEDDVLAKIHVFKNPGGDLIFLGSGSTQSTKRWFCQKCSIPLHPGMCDKISHPKTITELSICAV